MALKTAQSLASLTTSGARRSAPGQLLGMLADKGGRRLIAHGEAVSLDGTQSFLANVVDHTLSHQVVGQLGQEQVEKASP